MKRLGLALVASAIILGSGAAQSQQQRKYEAWRDPSAPQQAGYQTPEHTERLTRELADLLRVGRRDRAASPQFLDDLRRVLERHRRADQQLIDDTAPVRAPVIPPRVSELEDDFSDGDFTNDPAWELVSGEFFVARGGRLFSFVQPQSASRPSSDSDAVVQLFGALLGAKTGNQNSQDQGSSDPAAIFLPGKITNAFDLRTQLMSDERTGGVLEIGVFQGQDGKNGYRVQFNGNGELSLIRVGRRVTVLEQARFSFPAVQNRRPGTYQVRWVRDDRGRMRVIVDSKTLISFTDNGFRDDFDGFRMVNAEGRHAMDRIRIKMSN